MRKSLFRSIAAIAFTVGMTVPSVGLAYADPIIEPTVPVPPPAISVDTGGTSGNTVQAPVVTPPEVNNIPPPAIVVPQVPVEPKAPVAPVQVPNSVPVVQAPVPAPEPIVVPVPEPIKQPYVVPPPVQKPVPVEAPPPVKIEQPAPVDLPALVPPKKVDEPVTVPDSKPVQAPSQVNVVPPNAPIEVVKPSAPTALPEQPVVQQPEQVQVLPDQSQSNRSDKPVQPIDLPKPEAPIIPPELLEQPPVTAQVERVGEYGRGDSQGPDDYDRDRGNRHDDDRDRPPRPGHDRPDNPWGNHDDDDDNHGGPGGNHGNGQNHDDDDDGHHGGHHGPPPRPPVDIDHDHHGNIVINQYYTQVINQIIVNQPIVNPTSYVYLRNWDTNAMFRFNAGIDGRFVLPSGWCGGSGGYWSVSGGIQVPGFSAYGSVGGFYTSGGGCGYVPPPPPPVAYPPQLVVAPPLNYYGGAPVNLGNYYVPNQGCGCVYTPDYNTYLYGGFQDQQFVPTGYSSESIFQQTPTEGYPQWLDDGFGGLPALPDSMLSDLTPTEKAAIFVLAALVLACAGFATYQLVRRPQGNE